MKISVVIPNYNGKNLLAENLPQVIAHCKQCEIVVVDDGSYDESCEFIKKKYPRIKLIEKVTTSGFSTTVNLGFKAAKGDLIVLLNTDVSPKKDFLDNALKHFVDPKVFAVGLLDEDIEEKNTVLRGRGIGKFKKGFLLHSRGEVNKANTLWASGGSSVFRKTILENLDGLNEIYNPFYWEDIDISYRALKSGYKILFEPNARVIHNHSEGSIKKHFTNSQIKTIAIRNQIVFVWQNITDIKYLIQHFLWLPIHLLTTLIKHDFAFAKGLFLAFMKIPEVYLTRMKMSKSFTKTDKEILSEFRE